MVGRSRSSLVDAGKVGMKRRMLLIAGFAIACGSTDPDTKGSVGRVQDGEDSGGGAAGSDPGVRNQPPSIELLEPEAGAIPYADDIVVWQVQVDDAEDPLQSLQIEWTSDLLLALFYLGVLATGLAIGVQAKVQPRIKPTHVALLFALQPLFGALAGWLFLDDRLGATQWIGGGMIVSAVVLAARDQS